LRNDGGHCRVGGTEEGLAAGRTRSDPEVAMVEEVAPVRASGGTDGSGCGVDRRGCGAGEERRPTVATQLLEIRSGRGERLGLG
jgi:hypothetical protein